MRGGSEVAAEWAGRSRSPPVVAKDRHHCHLIAANDLRCSAKPHAPELHRSPKRKRDGRALSEHAAITLQMTRLTRQPNDAASALLQRLLDHHDVLRWR